MTGRANGAEEAARDGCGSGCSLLARHQVELQDSAQRREICCCCRMWSDLKDGVSKDRRAAVSGLMGTRRPLWWTGNHGGGRAAGHRARQLGALELVEQSNPAGVAVMGDAAYGDSLMPRSGGQSAGPAQPETLPQVTLTWPRAVTWRARLLQKRTDRTGRVHRLRAFQFDGAVCMRPRVVYRNRRGLCSGADRVPPATGHWHG